MAILRYLGRNPKDEYEKFYYQHVDQVYNFLYRMLKDSFLAEEVTQEVFIKVWEVRIDEKNEELMAPYLFRTAKNHALNFIRDTKRQAELLQKYSLRLSDIIEDAADTAVIASEFESALHSAIESLPEKRKRIFRLCKEEGKSYAEVAALLNLSVATVETQMVNALKHIRKALKEHAAVNMIVCLLLQNI